MIGSKVTYINMSQDGTVETVDELSLEDFSTWKEYRKECHRLVGEYRMAFHTGRIYLSCRSTKEWSER